MMTLDISYFVLDVGPFDLEGNIVPDIPITNTKRTDADISGLTTDDGDYILSKRIKFASLVFTWRNGVQIMDRHKQALSRIQDADQFEIKHMNVDEGKITCH